MGQMVINRVRREAINKVIKSCSMPTGYVLCICAIALGCDVGPAPSISRPLEVTARVADLISLAESDSGKVASLAPLQFPQDSLLHTQAAFEHVDVRAILYTPAGENLAVQSQIARLAIPKSALAPLPADENTAMSSRQNSQWTYQQLVASTLRVNNAIVNSTKARAFTAEYQRIQRVALNLAGSETNRLWVGEDALAIHLQTSADSECARQYTLTHKLRSDLSINLQWPMPACPDVSSLRHTRQWSAAVDNIQAYDSDSTDVLNGIAWITHTYGAVPAIKGAVVFDVLELAINDIGWVSITRSKRRSGRGPKTVSVQMPARSAIQLDTMIWEDQNFYQSDQQLLSYPETVSLRSKDGSVNWLITPLLDTQSAQHITGGKLTRASRVSGSHSGVGYLQYQSLD